MAGFPFLGSSLIKSGAKPRFAVSTRMKPLLILFANLKGNVGDFAIFHAMLEDVSRHYPGRPIHVATHGKHVIDEKRFHAWRATNPPEFEVIGKLPALRMPGHMGIFKRIGMNRWLGDRLLTQWTKTFAETPPVSKSGDYEALFIVGGEWSGFSNTTTMFAAIRAAARHNRNVFIYPFSVKKLLLSSQSQTALGAVFSHLAGRIIVRDSHSGDTMRHFRKDTVSSVDSVFLLGEVAAKLPPAENPDEKLITLAVTIGKGAKMTDLQQAIVSLQNKGYIVRLLTTCEREDAVEMVPLSQATGAEFVAPLSWQDVVMEFKRSALVVTNRLHCMIFTFFADVPLLPLLNREKVVGVRQDAKLTHAIQDVTELTAEKIAGCLQDRQRTLDEIRSYRQSAIAAHPSPLTVSTPVPAP